MLFYCFIDQKGNDENIGNTQTYSNSSEQHELTTNNITTGK